MFKAAVFRLTLWYLALIMVLSVVFSVTLYKESTQEFDAVEHRQEFLLHSNPGLLAMPNIAALNTDRTKQINQSEDDIASNLIYFNILIFLLGGGVSYLFALRTLQPIEESLESQRRFTADASHELRTPLTAMKTEIEVALREEKISSSEIKEILESSLEEIAKLEHLSNGLLTLARQEAGGKKVAFESFNWSEAVKSGIESVKPLAARKSITLHLDLQGAEVTGDSGSITELVGILVENAIKYSADKTEVTIKSFIHGHAAFLEVADQGVGISAEDVPHIFDRFYRSDQSRSKTTTQGYGLGLSIARTIIERHHGDIQVESVLEKGSTFKVRIPVRQSGFIA